MELILPASVEIVHVNHHWWKGQIQNHKKTLVWKIRMNIKFYLSSNLHVTVIWNHFFVCYVLADLANSMNSCNTTIRTVCANPDNLDINSVGNSVLDYRNTGGDLFEKMKACKLALDTYRQGPTSRAETLTGVCVNNKIFKQKWLCYFANNFPYFFSINICKIPQKHSENKIDTIWIMFIEM